MAVPLLGLLGPDPALYREEVDPAYDGGLKAGVPFCAAGTPHCDADYDYASRPEAVKDAVRSIELTGRIGKPLVTIHGTLDTLLPIATDSDVYDRLIDAQGAGERHRYYRIADGTHIDGLYGAFPDRLRPLLPCARTAFGVLTRLGRAGHPAAGGSHLPSPGGGPAEHLRPLTTSWIRMSDGGPDAGRRQS